MRRESERINAFSEREASRKNWDAYRRHINTINPNLTVDEAYLFDALGRAIDLTDTGSDLDPAAYMTLHMIRLRFARERGYLRGIGWSHGRKEGRS